MNLTLDVKQHDIITGGSSEMNPPSMEVPHNSLEDLARTCTDKVPQAVPVDIMHIEAPLLNTGPESVTTREDNPYKKEHIARIVQEVTIGPDITHTQRRQ